MNRWYVFRVDSGGHALRPAGSSDARTRDRAIKDVASGPGEYVAIPARYLDVALVHSEATYVITARVGKSWLA